LEDGKVREGGSRLGELRDDGWKLHPRKNDSMAMDGKSA